MNKADAKFKIGDKVKWINGCGVRLGIRTIIKVEHDKWGFRYFIRPIDTPWCSISEDNLHAII